jgi:hypothetical protein
VSPSGPAPPSVTPGEARGDWTPHWPRRRCGQSAPAAEGLAGEVRTGHGAGGGGSCCQPPADEYVQPQGTSSVCIHPSSVGVQHFGPFGSGAGPGSGFARATPLPDTAAAASAATTISFVFMETIFFRIRVVCKSEWLSRTGSWAPLKGIAGHKLLTRSSPRMRSNAACQPIPPQLSESMSSSARGRTSSRTKYGLSGFVQVRRAGEVVA